MGTVIRANTVELEAYTTHELLATKQGAIDYSVLAAEKCILQAGIDRADIDLLINTGTYREKNINEPSIASLIQKRLKIGLDPYKGSSGRTSFSFDLRNGVVGMLSAVQVASALLQQKMVKLALVVSGDVHPSQSRTSDFPYTHMGSATLLSWSDDEDKGFQNVLFDTSGGEYHGVDASVNLSDPKARETVDIQIQEDFGQRLGDFTITMFNKHVESGELDPDKINLALIAEPVPGFSRTIADSVGLECQILDDVYENYGNVLSSALPLGYHLALEKQLFSENDTILFIGAGSGLTFASSLYKA
jgi:3-oxoacyl-[acyl-carrier-protein] synthase-3